MGQWAVSVLGRDPAIFRVTLRCPQPRYAPAPRSVASTRTTPSAAQTATMPLSPAAPEPL